MPADLPRSWRPYTREGSSFGGLSNYPRRSRIGGSQYEAKRKSLPTTAASSTNGSKRAADHAPIVLAHSPT
jgi:hypothetical protein